jgi:hypothetical protein
MGLARQVLPGNGMRLSEEAAVMWRASIDLAL